MRSVTLLALVVTAGTALGQSSREPPRAGAAFRVTRLEPPPIHLPPVVSPSLKLLTQPAVQTELGLSPRQKDAVDALNGAWTIAPRLWEIGTLGLVTPEMGREAVTKRTKDFLDNGLLKTQRERLDQLVFQLREREFGAYAAFAMAARDLGLRPEQVEDVTNLKGLRVQEIAKHVTSGERFEKVKERVTATNGDTFERMTEMLTKTQRERLKEMRGREFGLLGREPPLAIDPPASPPSPPRYPADLFGLYDFEIRYLESGTVRSELKITDEQMPSVRRELDEWRDAYDRLVATVAGKVDRVTELHERTAKALDNVLTPTQRKRFDQLMAQRRVIVGGREAACGYPPVVATLKITPVQLSALKSGKTVADVLTKTELEALDKYLGQPFEFSAAVPIDPLRPAPNVAMKKDSGSESSSAIARSFLVLSNRLKLTDKQITRLRELAEDEPKIMELIQRELDFADTPPVIGATRSLTSANVVASRFKESIEEQCWSVLDPQQQSTARRIFGVKR